MRGTFFGPLGPVVAPRATSSAINFDDLVTEALASTQWRVCDGRLSTRDSHRVLGFIEVTKGLEFEVMSLVDGFEWFTYPTLADATAHFAHARPSDARSNRTFHSAFEAVEVPLVE